MDEKIIYAVGGTVAGLLVGAGGMYLFMAKKWEDEFVTELNASIDAELAATKKFYAAINKPSPEDLVRDAGLVVETEEDRQLKDEYLEKAADYDTGEVPLTPVARNVFTNMVADNSTWDADAEEAKREPGVPYILSQEEFFENEGDRVQTQLVYFAEDDVLADLNDKPVDEAVVGPDNLQKFGHGSGDPNIVYIRNEVLDIELEIMFAEGKYSEQVHGIVQHSASPGRSIRKFRLEDET